VETAPSSLQEWRVP
jgi:hypothetical protein